MVACIERYEWEREAQKPKLKKKKKKKKKEIPISQGGRDSFFFAVSFYMNP